MRILIAVSNLQVGGAQTFISRLSSEMHMHHSLYIYEVCPHGSENIVSILPEEVKIYRLPFILEWTGRKVNGVLKRFKISLNVLLMFKQFHFRSILRIHRVELVNTHLYHSDLFVTSTLQKSKLPIVLTDHGDYRFAIDHQISTLSEIHRIFGRINRVVYPSDSNADSLSSYFGNLEEHGVKIYYGIHDPEYDHHSLSAKNKLGLELSDFVFGMVARAIPQKGWNEAINAFKEVHHRINRNAHLVLVGVSRSSPAIEQEFDQYIKPFIHFIGYSSEPSYWIDAFDVGLLPTYFEGESLPNSIIEYLAFSKPVITTSIGGIPEMVDIGGQLAGVLINLDSRGHADIDALSQAMLSYMQDDQLLRCHSDLARLAFEKFRIGNCVKEYESLFNQLIG